MDGFGHTGFGIWMLLLWVLPIVLIVWLAQYIFPGRSSGRAVKTAREILDEEYARGRVSREEYLQRREDLGERADPES